MRAGAINRRQWAIGAAILLGSGLTLGISQAQTLVDDTRPFEVTARAFQPRFAAPGTFIRVQWQRPSNVPSSTVQGYVIWRGDTQNPLAVVGGLDTDSARRFIDSSAGRTVRAFDGAPGDVAGSRADFDVTGIRAGERYSYQVASSYQNGLQDRDNDDMPDDEQYMTPLSQRTRYITALTQPTLVGINGAAPANGMEVDPLSIAVTWNQTPGANAYVIWVSQDPTFRRGKKQFNGGKTLSVDSGGPSEITKTITLTGKLRNARRLFIAVGARNVRDPKPAPFGAIFSQAVQLKPIQSPPPPP
jgi:hypothetical protein